MSWVKPWAIAALGASALAVYCYQRLVYRRLQQYANIPQIKPSLLFGHLITMGKYMETTGNEPGMAGNTDEVFMAMNRDIGSPEVMVVDVWPVATPILFIRSHAVAEQVTKQSKLMPYSTPKAPGMEFMKPLVGPKSIITAHRTIKGPYWRELRKRYNPGFAPQHLMSLMPLICEITKPFMANLDKYRKSGETLTLEPLLTSLTFDIIGAVTMDVDFKAQLPLEQQSDMVQVYRDLLVLYWNDEGGNPWWTQPVTRIKRHFAAKRVDAIMRPYIRRKFEELKSQDRKSRSVLALSVQNEDEITDDLVAETVDQLKSFMFAGHDTTSILLQWAICEIYRHPRVLKTLRAELDELFGSGGSGDHGAGGDDDDDTDPQVVYDAFATRGDELMRKMTYTSAIIKETLRLYPPAATSRYVPPGTGFSLKLSDGSSFNADGLFLYPCHTKIQVDEEVYGATANDFVPERWVGNAETRAGTTAHDDDEDDEKNTAAAAGGGEIPAAAWRPFERGPRSCIGQELANIEARIILACVVRKYDFIKTGRGAAKLNEAGEMTVDEKGKYVVESELYKVRQVTMRPNDGIECKVRLRGVV